MEKKKKDRLPMNKARELLDERGIRPNKRLGQHFLQDPGIVSRIIEGAGLHEDDVVVEIGAGPGSLTLPLIPAVFHLVAIEKDLILLDILNKRLTRDREKVTLMAVDVLKLDFTRIYEKFKKKLRLIGNLPYNISSPFLERTVRFRAYIRDATLMFQQELAKRLTAVPNSKDYGSLSVVTQYHSKVSRILKVNKEAFYPRPKVDSMVLGLDFEQPHPVRAENEPFFHSVVRAAFRYRRKTILNSLERGMRDYLRGDIEKALAGCGIDPGRRAETLTIDEYICLSSAIERQAPIAC